MINRTPGRASASLDGKVLDCVQGALGDSTSRKLIVMHLMGAHPHYRLRFPSDANPFDDHVDAAETKLTKEGRLAWLRRYRRTTRRSCITHSCCPNCFR
jgi:heptose-I-phosphate ethanolaminephosphotransferase